MIHVNSVKIKVLGEDMATATLNVVENVCQKNKEGKTK